MGLGEGGGGDLVGVDSLKSLPFFIYLSVQILSCFFIGVNFCRL